MPPRNPTVGRYVVEIRDAGGVSLLLTSIDWTESEPNLAMSAVLKLVGFNSAARLNAKETSLAAVIRRREQRRRGRIKHR